MNLKFLTISVTELAHRSAETDNFQILENMMPC